jgi:hypothetical protein
MLIANGVEALGGECLGASWVGVFIGLPGSALSVKADFDNSGVILQADIV